MEASVRMRVCRPEATPTRKAFSPPSRCRGLLRVMWADSSPLLKF